MLLCIQAKACTSFLGILLSGESSSGVCTPPVEERSKALKTHQISMPKQYTSDAGEYWPCSRTSGAALYTSIQNVW